MQTDNHLSSYPSIYAIGHRYLNELLSGPVVVEEKVDGSQFSMCRLPCGLLQVRSKGQEIHLGAVPQLFNHAVSTAQTLDLHPGWVYRGEYLQKPKHNTLTYSRTPAKHVILFDVMTGPEVYLTPQEKRVEATRLDLDVVPTFFEGELHGLMEDRRPNATDFLAHDSILGGCKVEGFVVKNYNRFGIDKKILIGKFVSQEFKERHGGEWKKANPGTQDVVQNLIVQLRTEARWRKQIQHLRDAGTLTDTPQDIGPLMRELATDLLKEETDFIRDTLFNHFIKQIQRGVAGGFPEFYKKEIGIVSAPELTPEVAPATVTQ
jgi:hypothetical protein